MPKPEDNHQKYYKLTKEGGVSYYDNGFVYNLGLNVHPCPNKLSQSSCGEGLHLAKTIGEGRKNVPYADAEVYMARPGVILGEDSTKVRCAYIWLDRLLTLDEIKEVEKSEMTTKEAKKQLEKMLRGLPPAPLCGQDWIKEHGLDFTDEDFRKLTLTVAVDGKQTMTIRPNLKKKEMRTVLAALK